MIQRFRRNKSFRFALISILLTVAALGALMISAVAGQIGDDDLASLGSKAALGLAIIILIYVVPRMARGMKVEYLRSEFSIHIPNAGLVYCAVILVVTILSLSSGNNLLYLILSILLATMFLSWLSSRLCLTRLDMQIRTPEHIFAKEPVPFDIRLTNRRKLFPTFSISFAVSEKDPAGSSHNHDKVDLAYFPIIAGCTEARTRSERVYPRRGVYEISGYQLMTRFPFGFIEQRRFIEKHSEVYVYPQPLPLDHFPDIAPLALGRTESHIKGSGTDLYAIRNYLSSDHHHHIDWKATAKTAQLMVREFTRDDEWRVMIGFDPGVLKEVAERDDYSARFERAIGLAAGLAEYFTESGAEVRFLTPEEDSGYGIGRFHHYEILRQLAKLKPAPGETGLNEQVREIFQRDTLAEEQQRILIVSAPTDQIAGLVTASTQIISIEEL